MNNAVEITDFVQMSDHPESETSEEFTARIVATIEARMGVLALRD